MVWHHQAISSSNNHNDQWPKEWKNAITISLLFRFMTILCEKKTWSSLASGPQFIIKTMFQGIEIPIIKERQSWHCLIIIMRIPILARWHQYIKMGSRPFVVTNVFFCDEHFEIIAVKVGLINGSLQLMCLPRYHNPITDRPWSVIIIIMSSNGNISALLALCEGNSLVIDEFPSQWPVTWSFDVFCAWRNVWANHQDAGYLRCHHAHYDVTVM